MTKKVPSITPSKEDEIDYVTRVDVNIAILREIGKLRFRERLWQCMEQVAKELVRAGVDFSKVDFTKLASVTSAEIDSIYEDLFR